MIKIMHVNKFYSKKQVLFDVNLEVETGSFTVLKGASGSGKSTLLSIIGGLEAATNGKVVIDDREVNRLKGKARAEFYRHKVGMIFQGFYLQPQLTIGENIALMGMFAGMKKSAREQRVKELAERLGIVEILDSRPAEISGGQAERACVARAMFMEPKIILADEPTNNLDPENAQNVIEMLQKIQSEAGTTMIIASHDRMVEKYATQVVEMEAGRVKAGNGAENN